MSKLLRNSVCIALVAVTGCLLWKIPIVMDGVRGALLLCARSVIPALLVFMVLSDCIIAILLTDAPVGNGLKWTVFALGAVCGFPVGAAVCDTCVRRGVLSERDAERILPFCNNAGPAFVLGAVGNGLYGDIRVGWCIFLAQVLVAFCMVLPVKVSTKSGAVSQKRTSFTEVFFNAVAKAADAALRITVLICSVSAILSVLRSFVSQGLFAMLAGILEIGSGTAASLTFSPVFGVALCGFACGWSGICVFLQVLFASRSIKVKQSRYLFLKFLQGVMTALLAFVFYKMQNGT